MNGFVLDLATLRPTLNRLAVQAAAHDVELPDPEWIAPIQGELRVEKAGERVTVRGTVRTTARMSCARCLREFDLPVEGAFVVLAERSGSAARSEQEELERDNEMLFHDGRRLDLSGTVRETLLLELPITPHCREDCPGLCPTCGADWNAGPCAHSPRN